MMFFFFSSRRRHTRSTRDWSSDVCSSDLDLDEVLLAKLFASLPQPRHRIPGGFQVVGRGRDRRLVPAGFAQLGLQRVDRERLGGAVGGGKVVDLFGESAGASLKAASSRGQFVRPVLGQGFGVLEGGGRGGRRVPPGAGLVACGLQRGEGLRRGPYEPDP